jgi:hypothetical protein
VIGGHHYYPREGCFFVPPTPRHGALLVPLYRKVFGGQFSVDFKIEAIIYDPSVRYKQYLKGKYLYNGEVQKHELHDCLLSPTEFREDWNGNGSYGERGVKRRLGNQSTKDAGTLPDGVTTNFAPMTHPVTF